ncbi:MAG: cell division protein ZapA [Alistipes sp.]|nr:cell division protein ZapA [Alistipes sp.]MBR2008344.1 cell division protein ZapA [Alistipes sp.]MBR6671394.1 cell division protein ZapA [Alistipes sp.]
MAKQKISLEVNKKTYQMTIDSDKEEIYRLAERQVNANIAKLKTAFGDSCDIKDCLAITALQLSINNISLMRQNELDSDDMAALDKLSQMMDKHLNRITPRKKSANNKLSINK